GVQRPDLLHGTRPETAGRDHRLRGQVVHVRAEVAPGDRADQGRHQARRDRQDQDQGPDRRRPGRASQDHRRHRPLDGRHRGRSLNMATLTKRQKALQGKVDTQKLYGIIDALGIVKECATAKFDESIDVAVQLGIDAKKSDQVVRGAVVLPHGTGKTKRVAVFAQGAKAEEARAAGADIVGMEDLAGQVKAANLNFDVVTASPDTMRIVGTLGQILGPRGLMPTPKVGTVTPDVATAVKNAKAGQVQFRVDKGGIVHGTIGRRSFDSDKLKENLAALMDALTKAKPAASKGVYLRKIAVSSTMGIGVRVDTQSLNATA